MTNNPQNQQSVLALAKQGNPKAIAVLINRHLQPKGITAKVALKDGYLQVMLESSAIQNQQVLIAFLQKGLENLKIQVFKKVKVYGKQSGEEFPDWNQEFELGGTQLVRAYDSLDQKIIIPEEKDTNLEFYTVVKLKSEQGIDYTKLRDLLADQKFYRADKETWDVMCKALNKPVGSYFGSNEFDHFPCEDLQTIDNLWVTYSKGRYGFSVQGEIYRSLKYDMTVFKKAVGWKEYIFESQNFPTDEILAKSGNRGFLPCLCNYKGKILFVTEQIQLGVILSRLERCKIYL